MPCEYMRGENQTLTERKAEVKASVEALQRALAAGTVKAKVGPQGAITFTGWNESERAGVTDACAFRRIMVTGSALSRAAIAKAELLAGRSIDKRVIGQGIHSHDGGNSWHSKG